jgi:hypothetical protein
VATAMAPANTINKTKVTLVDNKLFKYLIPSTVIFQ